MVEVSIEFGELLDGVADAHSFVEVGAFGKIGDFLFAGDADWSPVNQDFAAGGREQIVSKFDEGGFTGPILAK